ncbi:MAG: hypothetical protein WDN31_05960 [Hyphomicrobium sp.]
MNQLAGVLDDMDLVRWPHRPRWWMFRKGELDKLKAEEAAASDTDLSQIRKDWLKKLDKKPDEKTEEDVAFEKAQPIRNHGLFSKAGARSDHRRMEREGAPRHRDLPARERRGPDAHPHGAR